MKKVFIGLTTYNGEKYIKEAIDSLLNQSYSNFTLFISDDASNDNTAEICREYAAKDSRIVYFRQEKNLGMFPNFDFVLNKAEGEYFMWASHDDVWGKDFIKICVENIENKNVDAAISTVADINSEGKILRELSEMKKLTGRPNFFQIAKYVLQPEVLGKCNLMYSLFKTKIAKEVWQIYPQRMEWGSDYHFSLALVSHFRVCVDEKVLFKKRQQHGGASSPLNKEVYVPIKNPKNHMFPFGRFGSFLRGQMEAVAGTPYKPLVLLILLLRLPRAFIIFLSQRNYKKFLGLKN